MIASMIQWVDALALWVTWWCAAAGVVGGGEVRTWRNLAISVGLIGVMVFSFCGALALTLHATPTLWWGTGLRIAVAVVAVGLYEYRFGISRQLRMLRDWFASLWTGRRHA